MNGTRWLRRLFSPANRPPAGIDCDAVVERLYEYIDEELDDSDLIARIRRHIRLCELCFPHYRFEKAFLRFIAEQGRSAAPPALRRRVFRRILQEERTG